MHTCMIVMPFLLKLYKPNSEKLGNLNANPWWNITITFVLHVVIS